MYSKALKKKMKKKPAETQKGEPPRKVRHEMKHNNVKKKSGLFRIKKKSRY